MSEGNGNLDDSCGRLVLGGIGNKVKLQLKNDVLPSSHKPSRSVGGTMIEVKRKRRVLTGEYVSADADGGDLTKHERMARVNALNNAVDMLAKRVVDREVVSEMTEVDESEVVAQEIVEIVTVVEESGDVDVGQIADESEVVYVGVDGKGFNDVDGHQDDSVKDKRGRAVVDDKRPSKRRVEDDKIGGIKLKVAKTSFIKHAKSLIEEELGNEFSDERLREFDVVRQRTSSRGRKRRFTNVAERAVQKIVKVVVIPDKVSIKELASRMSERVKDVCKRAKLVTGRDKFEPDSIVDAEVAMMIVNEFKHEFKRVSGYVVEDDLKINISEYVGVERPPIVTVMGHVDHGKTSLLDALRSTDVASGETGGITQHIGAYQVRSQSGKKITFVDTPGHEAFTEMRMRGANVTDIVVLVVAVDDGIMEQTIEAINHAKAANVDMIVAVNKIDKPKADVDRVASALLGHGVIVESMGGDTLMVPVSAKNRINLDKLEEAILMVAEMKELKAPVDCRAYGTVIEARIDRSRGVLVTLIVRGGTLSIGDVIVVGSVFCKVKAMFDCFGKSVKSATPSTPVEVMGFEALPNNGDVFCVAKSEKQAREVMEFRLRKLEEGNADDFHKTLSIDDIIGAKDAVKPEECNIILKCDVIGSLGAIVGAISRLNCDDVKVNILHGAVGDVNESDVSLAKASKADIVTFNVKVDQKILDTVKCLGINIKSYGAIYQLIDGVKEIMNGVLSPINQDVYLGKATVKMVVGVNKNGAILGCYVIDGKVVRGSNVRVIRNGQVIKDGGKLKVLRRFKDDVQELRTNFECGMCVDIGCDVLIDDQLEIYNTVVQNRSV